MVEPVDHNDWAAWVVGLDEGWWRGRRWFLGKSDGVRAVRLVDVLELGADPAWPGAVLGLVLVEVESRGDVPPARYGLPLAVGPGPDVPDRVAVAPGVWVGEALDCPAFHAALLRLADQGAVRPGYRGRFRAGRPAGVAPPRCQPLAETSSNSLVLVAGGEVIKYLRRLESGPNLEWEMIRFLSQAGLADRVPRVTAWLQYEPADGGGTVPLALVQAHIPNEGDLWTWTRRYLLEWAHAGGPADPTAGWLPVATALADALGSAHRALMAADAPAGFAARPLTAADLTGWARRLGESAEAAFDQVERVAGPDTPDWVAFRADVPRFRQRVAALCRELTGLDPRGQIRCRVHGDFHLGQVLKTGKGVVLIDFEGEPLAPPAERAGRHSPLKDVAGLLRSLHYAARSFGAELAARRGTTRGPARLAALARWPVEVGRVFLAAYRPAAGLAPDDPGLGRLLTAHKLEKALYELVYEAGSRPDWLPIPAAGVAACLEEWEEGQREGGGAPEG